MKILVTGAAGAIGSHVAEALVREGHEVLGIDSLTPYYARSLKEINVADIKKSGVDFSRVDLVTDDLAPHLADVDVVYHFAAQPGISAAVPFADYLNNNIVATERLLQAVKRVGTVQLFVHISTSSVYGKFAAGDETTEPKPTSYYGVTKLAAEQLALSYHREAELPVVVLRLFSVYGERERPEKLYHKFIKHVLNGEPFPLHEGSEDHIRSYTYVGDIVAGCLLVLDHVKESIGHIFNIGNDRTITTGEGIAILEKALGKKADNIRKPTRPGDQLETAANITKARRILGYDPKVEPKEGLAREVAWYKKHIHGKVK
jgi:nucleoside-diphosphate-sugar epimerase